MKRIAPLLILFLFAVIAWNVFSHGHGYNIGYHGDFVGDDFDGPLGALLGLVLAGGGLLIGGLVTLFVGIVLAVVFAGVGVVLVTALALVAVVIAAALTPVLLPVLLPLALIWWLLSRRNKARTVVA